jgi:hypothetical protein
LDTIQEYPQNLFRYEHGLNQVLFGVLLSLVFS